MGGNGDGKAEHDPSDVRTWRGVYERLGIETWLSNRDAESVIEHLDSLPGSTRISGSAPYPFDMSRAGFVVFHVEGHEYTCMQAVGLQAALNIEDVARELGGRFLSASAIDEGNRYELFEDGVLIERYAEGHEALAIPEAGGEQFFFESQKRWLSPVDLETKDIGDLLSDHNAWAPGLPLDEVLGVSIPVLHSDDFEPIAFEEHLTVFALLYVKQAETREIPNPFLPGQMMLEGITPERTQTCVTDPLLGPPTGND